MPINRRDEETALSRTKKQHSPMTSHQRADYYSPQAGSGQNRLDTCGAIKEPKNGLSRSEQKTVSTTQNNRLTGKVPYKFESIPLQRRICEPLVPQRRTTVACFGGRILDGFDAYGGIELMSMSLCGASRSSPGEQLSIKPPTRLIALSFSTPRCKDASLTLVGTAA
jgi:hypothetical protein